MAHPVEQLDCQTCLMPTLNESSGAAKCEYYYIFYIFYRGHFGIYKRPPSSQKSPEWWKPAGPPNQACPKRPGSSWWRLQSGQAVPPWQASPQNHQPKGELHRKCRVVMNSRTTFLTLVLFERKMFCLHVCKLWHPLNS